MKYAVVNRLVAISIFLFCASCTSVPAPEVSIKPGMALIVIHRSGNVFLQGLATVEINGSQTVNLLTTENYTGDIPPGPTVIAVYSYIIPGRYVLKFTAEAGKTYRFAVWGRGDSAGKQGRDFTATEMNGAYQIIGN